MKRLLPVCFLLCTLTSTAQDFPITDFGAVGNGSTDNTTAIQLAIENCHASGGGRVLVEGGDFVTSTIELKSNVELHVAAGARLLGSTSLSSYPEIDSPVPTVMNESKRALIHAVDADNIAIRGSGKIDGRGSNFIGQDGRPFALRLISCTNVIIEDIELRNSGFWMMHNLNLDTVTIRNVTIYNHGNSNNDGLSLDGCRNVVIENCTVDSNNDPLVLKATGHVTCENVVARNCTLATWKRAIKIGTETLGHFRNIHLHDLTVQWSSLALPPIIGVADCGINLAIVDGGSMENVLVENVTIESVRTAIFIRLGNRANSLPGEPDPEVGTLRNVTLRNITATVRSNITSSITGVPGHYAEDITLQNIQITFPGGEPQVPNGVIVPENEGDKPENFMFGEYLPAHGLFVRHVSNLVLEDVCFTWQSADLRPAIYYQDLTISPIYEAQQVSSGTCLLATTAAEENAILDRKLPCMPFSDGRIIIGDLQGNTQIVINDLLGRTWSYMTSSSDFTSSPLPNGLYTVASYTAEGMRTCRIWNH